MASTTLLIFTLNEINLIMKSLVPLIIILLVLCMVGGSLQSTFSQKPNTYGVIDNITNLGQPNETSQDNYKVYFE